MALESTVISHGLPWPHNLTLARRMELVVREGGAVPATIGVIGGSIRVGLDDAELEQLARGGD
ncbi:MAG TPA: pseudouridine-5'-phosphate glycosidase, partial [Gemmatimonadales bacterium]|nr:pseudouridine-5'-phosphate glycosidase [Gemmatimonadales bacterium]